MRAKPISRQEAKKALAEIPMHEVLLVSNSELTAKQMEFAKQVALGNTGAESYRKAYNTKAKKKTQGDHASRLKADDRIKAAILAFERANLAATYRSASGLRELVIDSLVQVLIDPETKPAQKIQAAKTIGTINEVSLFTEHKTITHIQDSADIKEKILAQIKTLMLGTGAGNEVQDVDAIELLNELTTEQVVDDESEQGDPHSTPTPSELNEPPPDHVHTIPPKPSQSETTPIVSEIKE
jgi:hypothetical protein